MRSRDWRSAVRLAMLLALPAFAHGADVTDPAANGPYNAAQHLFKIPGTQGATLNTDVYFPQTASGTIDPAAAPCPVVVLGHGFMQSRNQHVNQGRQLASRGYIVLIPDFVGGSDHSRNAIDLTKLIDWILARHGDTQSVFYGRVWTTRVGATGHSAGGLSAILATARDPRIRVLAPMDPVDIGGLGVQALAQVTVPVAITYSEPSSCNANGSAATLSAAAGPPRRGVKIVGATHTDAQDPASTLSGLFCGAANATRQMLYRRYVVGWFEYWLRADAQYAPWAFALPGGTVAADRADGSITYDDAPASVPFDAWRGVIFGAGSSTDPRAAATGDADHDGLSNLLEYAFNRDATRAETGPVPRVSTVQTNGTSYLAIEFPRVITATDITYVVLTAETPGTNWVAGATYGLTNCPVTATTTEVSRTGLGVETIVVRDNVPQAAAGTRFLRVRVDR